MILLIVTVWLCGMVLMAVVVSIDDACRELPTAVKPLVITLWPVAVICGIVLALFGLIAERGRR